MKVLGAPVESRARSIAVAGSGEEGPGHVGLSLRWDCRVLAMALVREYAGGTFNTKQGRGASCVAEGGPVTGGCVSDWRGAGSARWGG